MVFSCLMNKWCGILIHLFRLFGSLSDDAISALLTIC